MKNIIKIISYFLIILICLSPVSCELQEVKLVDNPVCELPCWKGIEMNMSVDEVKSKLKDMPEIQYGSMMTYENPQRELDTTIVAYFLKQNFEGVSFYFSDNQLKLMVFRNPKGCAETLEYWITKIAEPSQVILYGGGPTYHGVLWFSSFFVGQPLCLDTIYSRQDKIFEVNELTKILNVTVFEPDFDLSASNVCYSSYRQEYEQDWIGYGTYKIYP